MSDHDIDCTELAVCPRCGNKHLCCINWYEDYGIYKCDKCHEEFFWEKNLTFSTTCKN